jgi:hypothetical protein
MRIVKITSFVFLGAVAFSSASRADEYETAANKEQYAVAARSWEMAQGLHYSATSERARPEVRAAVVQRQRPIELETVFVSPGIQFAERDELLFRLGDRGIGNG